MSIYMSVRWAAVVAELGKASSSANSLIKP